MDKTSASSALRMLQILELVAGSDSPVSAGELIAATGLPKPTVHRIVSVAEEGGVLVREPEGRRYLPGPRLAALALDVLSHSGLRAPRHAILQGLVATVGETCNLTMLDGGEVVYLDRVEAAWPLRLHFQRGSRVPAHCSASGKLLLALMPARERKRLLDAMPMQGFTTKTVVDRGILAESLKRIRRERVSTDDEEFLEGTVCVAVPIEDGARTVPAALAVHAPSSRMSLQQALAHLPILRKAASQLAKTF
ncbi:MAG TPA: IclR family transcriptional regulator [Rhodocyclaceae bacterium]|nr:IclR family transcriptional regulator [Rhodocyclaceae bacterium]